MGSDKLSCSSLLLPIQTQAFGKQIAVLATCWMLISCLAYSLALKMEITYSSEILVNFQWTTWYYIPEDRTLNGKKCFIAANVT
jgi:hypothetical protein